MKDYPLIKYVIAFIIGIVSTKYFHIQLYEGILLVLFFISISIVLFLFKGNKIIFIVHFLSVLVLGNIYLTYNSQTEIIYPFEKTKISKTTIFGEVKDIHLIHANKFEILLASDSLIVMDSTHRIGKNFQANISFSSKRRTNQLYNQLNIGNKIKLVGTLRKGRGMRNPGEFDYYKYLQSKNIVGLVYVKNITNFRIVDNQISIFANNIFKVRKWVAEKIEQNHNSITSGLLKGLLLADRSEIDYRTKESFINSGVIHVLAVSGLHVGFIVLIFLFLTNRIPIYSRTIITIIGLIAFLMLTGNPTSVFRATIMAIIMLLIFLSNRTYNSINSLFIAALIILLFNPQDIFNPGFQLSFSAVLSILIIYPIFNKKITTKNKAFRFLFLFSTVSFSAQLGTLPFTLIYFHKLSIISLIANLFVIPMIGIIVGLGILTIFTSIFSSIFALYFASANMLFTDLMMLFVNMTGTQSFSFFYIPSFSVIDGIIYYIFLSFGIYSIHKFSNKIVLIAVLSLLGLNLFFWLNLDNKQLLPDGKLSVMMIDIGQGDGILIKFPNGETALVDAGNAMLGFDNGERVIAPLLRRLSIKQIDHGFISHVDSDHYKGFLSLIKNGWIKEIYKPRLDTSLKKDLRLEKIIHENNVKLNYYSKSKMEIGNARLYILNDTTNAKYNYFSTNDKSGILKIVYGYNSVLFVGDAERSSEKFWSQIYGKFLDSDILKIGHHGSKYSSSQKFINSVSPSIGLISAGLNNSFGHPAKSIIERFKNSNVTIYRTDIDGAIILQSDGEKINKINWREF